MNKTKYYALSIALFAFGCGMSPDSEFKRTAESLKVPADVVNALQDLQKNQHNSLMENFSILRRFCYRRQIAFRKESMDLPPVLTKDQVRSLFGKPHQLDDDGHWLYFLNQDKTWNLRLEFRGDRLFLTGHRQLIPAEDLIDNQSIDRTD